MSYENSPQLISPFAQKRVPQLPPPEGFSSVHARGDELAPIEEVTPEVVNDAARPEEPTPAIASESVHLVGAAWDRIIAQREAARVADEAPQGSASPVATHGSEPVATPVTHRMSSGAPSQQKKTSNGLAGDLGNSARAATETTQTNFRRLTLANGLGQLAIRTGVRKYAADALDKIPARGRHLLGAVGGEVIALGQLKTRDGRKQYWGDVVAGAPIVREKAIAAIPAVSEKMYSMRGVGGVLSTADKVISVVDPRLPELRTATIDMLRRPERMLDSAKWAGQIALAGAIGAIVEGSKAARHGFVTRASEERHKLARTAARSTVPTRTHKSQS